MDQFKPDQPKPNRPPSQISNRPPSQISQRPPSQISQRPPSQISSGPSPAGDKAGEKVEKLKGGSPSQTRIEMTCPSCGTAGTIKMGSLGQQIACKKCAARFRITHTGRIVPATESQILKRPAFDEGIEPPHRLVMAWNKLPPWGKAATVSGGTIGGMLILYVLMLLMRVSLPAGLEARSRMAGEAVAFNYASNVRALAASGTQGQAEEWLSRTRPPKWSSVNSSLPVRIDVKVLFQQPDRAGTLVTVQPGVEQSSDVQLLQRGDSARSVEPGGKATGTTTPAFGQQSLLLYWVYSGNDWLLDGKQTLENQPRSMIGP